MPVTGFTNRYVDALMSGTNHHREFVGKPYLHPTKGWRGEGTTKPRGTNKRRMKYPGWRKHIIKSF